MILEAKFTEVNHELPCDPSVSLHIDGGGGGGDVPSTAVLYTPQTPTDEQKAQARENIGFEGAALGILVALGIAPVLLDADGAVLTDGDDSIFVNT